MPRPTTEGGSGPKYICLTSRLFEDCRNLGILEIGTYCGNSALRMASALPGVLLTSLELRRRLGAGSEGFGRIGYEAWGVSEWMDAFEGQGGRA